MAAVAPCRSASLAELVAEYMIAHDALAARIETMVKAAADAGLEADLTLRFRKAQNGGYRVKAELSRRT